MNCEIEESGQIGNIRYEIRCYSKQENVYEVVIFAQGMGLTVVHNSGHIACQAFIEGMKAGKCRNIGSIANKNLGFSEYGGSAKDD